MEFKDIVGPIIVATIGALGFIIKKAIKLFIDPVSDLRKVICECRCILAFRANRICNPASKNPDDYFQKKKDEEFDEENLADHVKTGKELRAAAVKLKISIDRVLVFKLFEIFKLIPRKERLIKASNILVRLSNSSISGSCEENVKDKELCELLLVNEGKV